MDGILASIFLGFWSILGGKLGGKPEPRSTQKGIEKRCKKEEQRDCQKSRNKNFQHRAPPRVLGPGEGVGGGVNPSPREEGKGMRPVQRAKPPQPRGLVGFYFGPGSPKKRFSGFFLIFLRKVSCTDFWPLVCRNHHR